MHPLVPTFLSHLGLGVVNAKGVGAKTPAKVSSGENAERLGQAAVNRANKLSPGNPRNSTIALNPSYPDPDDKFYHLMGRMNDYASHQRALDPETRKHLGSIININPNNSAEYLAHELGHHITDQTDIGNMISSLRRNPKLAIAMGASGGFLGVPLVQSALQEGDDDIAEGIAASALFASPVLIDEALATKNALAIMKDAGMPATMGQRARLAGGYLSYATIPLINGMGGNMIGNVLDDHTAIYDL